MIYTEMVDDFKSHLSAGDNFFGGEEIWRRLDTAGRFLLREIIQKDPTFFIARTNISLVADQALYDLPQNARHGTRIFMVEDLGTDAKTDWPYARLKEALAFDAGPLLSQTSTFRFAMENDQIRCMPTPSQAKTNAATIWYVPTLGSMIQGTASAGTSTSLTSFTSDPNWTSNFGKIDLRDDYYNGMHLYIYDGTGLGQRREITDYASRVFTVDTWTTTPDTTSKFCVLSPVPEDFHSTQSTHASMVGAIKNRNRFRELRRQFYGTVSEPGELKEMLQWISSRQYSKPDQVIPVDLGE